MKKIISNPLLLLLTVLVLISCNKKEEPSYSIINGTIENAMAYDVFLQGNDFEEKIALSPEGNFQDTLYLNNNGFYKLFIGRYGTEIYLEKGKNLTIDLDANRLDETLKFSGDLASTNNFLTQKYLWNDENLDYKELFSLNEADFKKRLNSDQKQMDSILDSHKIESAPFKKLLKEEDEYAKAALIENYQDAHRYFTGVEDYQVGSNFYDDLKNINYADTLAYRNSTSYQNLLDAHFNRLTNDKIYNTGENEPTVIFLKEVDKALPNGYAKDKIMTDYLQFGLKPDKYLDEAFNIYKATNPSPENLENMTGRYNLLKNITAGNPSPTFNFENHKGGTTSLSSFKGKYVYIDVWATWCGPCLREIPFLKEVEKDYGNKNIAFVGISIDEPRDYEKWKEMVTEKSLVGTQLMADNNWQSNFVQEYGILGIPRFILLDPKGNIVAADAPRPSDPELRTLLDSLL